MGSDGSGRRPKTLDNRRCISTPGAASRRTEHDDDPGVGKGVGSGSDRQWFLKPRKRRIALGDVGRTVDPLFHGGNLWCTSGITPGFPGPKRVDQA